MKDFPLLAPEQLPDLLQSLRKASGLTQAEAAERLGVTQQTMSAMERNAQSMSVARLMRLLAILGVELRLVMRDAPSKSASAAPGVPPGRGSW